MVKLEPAQMDAAAKLFAAIDGADIRLASIRERGGGRVFADDADKPSVAYMEGDDGFGYIAGAADDLLFVDELFDYLINESLPGRKPEDRQVILFSGNDLWKALLDIRLARHQGFRIRRHTFRFDPKAFEKVAGQLPPLPEEYELRGGGGLDMAVFCGEEEAARCRAVFSGAHKAEMEVYTSEAHRRKGLAFFACTRFMQACLEQGVTPHWSCWDYNKPSLKLALKLGFYRLPDLEVNFCEMQG